MSTLHLADGTTMTVTATSVTIFDRMGAEPWTKAQRGVSGVTIAVRDLATLLPRATAAGQSAYVKRGRDLVRVLRVA